MSSTAIEVRNSLERSARDFAEVVIEKKDPSSFDLASLVQEAMDVHANQKGCRWADDALDQARKTEAFQQLEQEIKLAKTADEALALPSFMAVAKSLEMFEVCRG